jgi:hypothetical protein
MSKPAKPEIPRLFELRDGMIWEMVSEVPNGHHWVKWISILDAMKCTEENAKLEATVARLSKPVTPEEWVFHGGVNFSEAHKKALSAILEARGK